ncbi:uncharacterized protein CCOS01_06267 [Colletotrichum costaricense]|uniref:Uncharacterized protein n=2 Tax=Colletotrichum acutatum species complex TaxID=2707335 RepID=A0AAJ0E0J5_9PEZI|nr:uncharacterized protein CCOS01_06267 [Colletotrichum costaricense]XP_060376216.1 uncharacterized protein CTAM01_13161 [Colletotrichum tamarilloi]KAK1483936.1 hypothetical protein CTAM01_13161 [Colletotrichum tamarilloi]KAK1528433.1 hypothetical protein CCOS01_06267 [Colletotrichum costaricense]
MRIGQAVSCLGMSAFAISCLRVRFLVRVRVSLRLRRPTCCLYRSRVSTLLQNFFGIQHLCQKCVLNCRMELNHIGEEGKANQVTQCVAACGKPIWRAFCSLAQHGVPDIMFQTIREVYRQYGNPCGLMLNGVLGEVMISDRTK